MSNDLTFPLALCKAQFGIWLHSLEMLETVGSRILQDSIALTRAGADAVMRAEDWPALAMAPVRALRGSGVDGTPRAPATAAAVTPTIAAARAGVGLPASRRTVVTDALHTLYVALATAPPARPPRIGHKSPAKRAKA
ncbi:MULTISPECIES: hypothetical protein [unclassified Variovorax]|jgi:hypothetical protein|uniref:hypothetical protein n=1 Tax=unclassified Variovorax TaxID=663243 RepID=UPI000AEFBB11|nr:MULTISPECIES: hypothetical protein [unclassified Variovorax]MBS79714.1 hypothetical protein [Variovorax sp.]MCT8177108.1 hypothetical protein [Variovorax sp. CY25R-8]